MVDIMKALFVAMYGWTVVTAATNTEEPESFASNSVYQFWLDANKQSYKNSQFLDDSMVLHWTIVDEEMIQIAVAVAGNTVGWIGLGMAEMGGMAGSDMLIFETSNHTLYDAYSIENGVRPLRDVQQDWTLRNSVVLGAENAPLLLFEAQRKLETGDSQDWPFTKDSDPTLPGTKVIAAWGPTPEMHYHSHRVQSTVRFFGGHDDGLGPSDAEGSILFALQHFRVPPHRTTTYGFRCFTVTELIQNHGLPGNKPVHLIGFEWVVGYHNVHHIALYSSPDEHIDKCDQTGPHSFVHVWNKGQSLQYSFPDNVGMLLADESHGKRGRIPKSFRLEVHYENPRKQKGVVDSSGVRVLYTTQMRQHTAAIMELGDPRVKLIGKSVGQKGLNQHTFKCPGSCTSQYVSEEGITVIYEMLHMHRHGVTMQNVHTRDGRELKRSSVQYFDFEHGAQTVKQDRFQILPGDSFDTTCHYNSTGRGLQFGFEASREMCMAWVLYYPAANIHLSCSYEADEQECVAQHKATKSKTSLLGRTFGTIRHDEEKTKKSFVHKNGHSSEERSGNSGLGRVSVQPENRSDEAVTSMVLFMTALLLLCWLACRKRRSASIHKKTGDNPLGSTNDNATTVRCPTLGANQLHIRQRKS